MGMPVLRRTKQRKILCKLRRCKTRSVFLLFQLRVETCEWAELAEILPGVRQTASIKQ